MHTKCKSTSLNEVRITFKKVDVWITLCPDDVIQDDVDVTKRRGSGFVRIGRRGPWSYDQQFVRIGRGDFNDADNDELAADQSADKRARGQAFVRIGRKPANFVRIGRAFVRIGKSGYDASAIDELVDNNAMTTSSGENADHREITEEWPSLKWYTELFNRGATDYWTLCCAFTSYLYKSFKSKFQVISTNCHALSKSADYKYAI